jgi:starch phosphorylase
LLLSSLLQATAYSVRDRLIEFWNDTNNRITESKTKRVYYLSIEFLLGRTLQNGITNLRIEDNYGQAVKQLGFLMEELYDQEPDAGLGNGGLGRLAACYLDSLATQNFAAWGYGLRYTYGMFRQEIFQGWQAEIPDNWLKRGNPWEIPRFDVKYVVQFYGATTHFTDDDGVHVSVLPNMVTHIYEAFMAWRRNCSSYGA